MIRFLRVAILVFLFSAGWISTSARAQSPNEVARFLAGLPLPQGSAIAPASFTAEWRRHAAEMTARWRNFERGTTTRIQVWAAAKLPPSPPAMFYMFGGPDFPHAKAFFPGSRVYVLSGLEPVGRVPLANEIFAPDIGFSLVSLRQSLGNYLDFGYFITREMNTQLKAGKFNGVLPLLYVFLARTDHRISSVEFVTLSGGKVVSVKGKARGVRITFAGRDGVSRTLYYFSTDLSNGGVGKSGFLTFCASFGSGGSLLKSASYLLHTGGFTKVRDFLLKQSAVIVQDASGIPFKYFTPGAWRLRAFGQYVPPIPVFKNYDQPDMAQFFARGAERVNFGIGYHSHPTRTGILVAEKVGAQ